MGVIIGPFFLCRLVPPRTASVSCRNWCFFIPSSTTRNLLRLPAPPGRGKMQDLCWRGGYPLFIELHYEKEEARNDGAKTSRPKNIRQERHENVAPGEQSRPQGHGPERRVPKAELRHIPWSSVEVEALNPLLGRHFVVGQNVMLARVLLKKGCIVPEHSHHNEQVTYVLEGALKFGSTAKKLW